MLTDTIFCSKCVEEHNPEDAEGEEEQEDPWECKHFTKITKLPSVMAIRDA